MNVLVNGRFLSRRMTGVERYAGEILSCLEGRVRVVRPPPRVRGASGHAWEQFVLPGRLQKREVLWSPANTGPLAISNQVLTVHDLTPLEHPGWFKPAFSSWYRLFLPVLVRRVNRLAVSSEYMRKKILGRFSLSSEKVQVVPGGVNLQHFHPDYPPSNRLPSCYVLFVGTLQPRKNLGLLLAAWEQVVKKFPDCWLVVAGIEDHSYRGTSLPRGGYQVLYIGYVPDTELAPLYAGAMAFVLPSLEEGFGLPLLEAMACGTPVVAARAGALPEIAGEGCLFFNSNDPSDLTGRLAECLGDPNLRDHLSERGRNRAKDFSWQVSAEKLWKVLETCS